MNSPPIARLSNIILLLPAERFGLGELTVDMGGFADGLLAESVVQRAIYLLLFASNESNRENDH